MNEFDKLMSNLHLNYKRYKDKLRMCPLEITKKERQSYLIYNYILELKRELYVKEDKLKKLENCNNKTIEYLKSFDYKEEIEEDIKINVIDFVLKKLGGEENE